MATRSASVSMVEVLELIDHDGFLKSHSHGTRSSSSTVHPVLPLRTMWLPVRSAWVVPAASTASGVFAASSTTPLTSFFEIARPSYR